MRHNNFFNRLSKIRISKDSGVTVSLVVALSVWFGASAMEGLKKYGGDVLAGDERGEGGVASKELIVEPSFPNSNTEKKAAPVSIQ